MPQKTTLHRRADLYAQVRTEPMRNVAKRHGVSDVVFGKSAASTTSRCRAEGIGHG